MQLLLFRQPNLKIVKYHYAIIDSIHSNSMHHHQLTAGIKFFMPDTKHSVNVHTYMYSYNRTTHMFTVSYTRWAGSRQTKYFYEHRGVSYTTCFDPLRHGTHRHFYILPGEGTKHTTI